MLMNHPMDYFERIFIINLPARTDRKAEIAAQLKVIGLSLAEGPVELFAAVRPDAAEGFPSIGARGCFMSHLGVLRKAHQLGLQRVAIFEDDLDFAADFNARIQPLLGQLVSVNWSIFYGGYHVERALQGQAQGELLEAQTDELIGTTHFLVFQGGAIAAAVQYLEAILARPAGDPDGGPMRVDGAYNWFRRANPQFKTVLAIPELGFQGASRTDIHDLRWYDRAPRTANSRWRGLPATDQKYAGAPLSEKYD
jgi:glycosyl transferase family 25